MCNFLLQQPSEEDDKSRQFILENCSYQKAFCQKIITSTNLLWYNCYLWVVLKYNERLMRYRNCHVATFQEKVFHDFYSPLQMISYWTDFFFCSTFDTLPSIIGTEKCISGVYEQRCTKFFSAYVSYLVYIGLLLWSERAKCQIGLCSSRRKHWHLFLTGEEANILRVSLNWSF